MKILTLPVLAASIALATPAFADDSPRPAQSNATQAAASKPDGKTMQTMQHNLATMQKQLEKLGKAKTAEERQKIINEHMQTMQANMGMVRGMQSGMMGCPMMQGGMGMMGQGMPGQGMMGQGMMGQGMMGQGMMGQGMAGGGDMMTKRMEMMERRMDMMQMMMQQGGMPMMQPSAPAKSAN